MLLLLPFLAQTAAAQTLDISYSIDTVGGKDFFLVETISRAWRSEVRGLRRRQAACCSGTPLN